MGLRAPQLRRLHLWRALNHKRLGAPVGVCTAASLGVRFKLMDPLHSWLRPAGGGVYTVSTGRSEQEALQKALYGVTSPAQIEAGWHRELARVPQARAAILGIPSDTGAGLVRGAAYGPQALRQAWLAREGQGPQCFGGLIDVGDVRVVPQLLHDEMLSEAQLAATRAALYPEVPAELSAAWPVSPLSIAQEALECMLGRNPALKLLVMGGDHSVAWPVVAALAKHEQQPWAIVHFDAHTDLLETRIGIRYCFATWAYHAVKALGDGARLVQLGIRASGRDRIHWESTYGVRQLWAQEVNGQSIGATVDQVLSHLHAQRVRNIYISNDIDGTDAASAPSTGTPEPAGLRPELVLAVIAALGQNFNVVAADLVEVAPPIGAPTDAARTCELGVSYLLASATAML